MSRRITQDDLDAEIRSHLAGVRAPEPASLGEVLRRLPERARARRRWSPTIPAMVGSAALAIILIAAVAIVGLPFIGSRAGPAAPAATPGPLASAAAGDLGRSERPSRASTRASSLRSATELERSSSDFGRPKRPPPPTWSHATAQWCR